MRAFARVKLPDDTVVTLGHGDFIGRVWSAALIVDDPRVSEGHAMISLRGGELWILALRRRIAVDGKSVGEARLRAGQVIELVDRLALRVESVDLPDEVLGIVAPGMPPVPLPAVAALYGKPRPVVQGRHDLAAPCLIWTTGEGWRYSLNGQTHPLEVGANLTVDGEEFRIVWLAIGGSGRDATRVTGGVDPPLRIVVKFDTAQIFRGDDPPLMLAGQQARILSELVAMGAPVGWEVVARELWPEEPDEHALRKRWDTALVRFRTRLRESRVRPDLIRSAGNGLVELVVRPGDIIEDKN